MKKFWLGILIFLITITVLMRLTIPFPREISYQGTAIEYSPVDETVAIPHEVIIKGIYNRVIFGKDTFEGTFYISDVEGLTYLENNVSFRIERNPGTPDFRDAYGQPHSTELFEAHASRYFRNLTVMFADTFEKRPDGSSASFNYNTGHFLVLHAQNREDALDCYRQLQKQFYVRS